MAADFNSHADEDQLERYSMQTSPEPEAGWLEEHLLVCEACRERLEHTVDYVNSMRRAATQLRQTPPKAFSLTAVSWPMRLAVAAAIVLAVIAVERLRPWDAAIPAVAVQLSATRGPAAMAEAPAGKPLDLHLDVTGLPTAAAWRIEVVNSEGARVWVGSRTVSSANATVSKLASGTYFVRLYSAEGALLREYGLQLRALPH